MQAEVSLNHQYHSVQSLDQLLLDSTGIRVFLMVQLRKSDYYHKYKNLFIINIPTHFHKIFIQL